MDKYTWDNKEIIKRYISCLKELIKTSSKNKKDDLLTDLDNLKDMILFSILELPVIGQRKLLVKRYLDLDRDFINLQTTSFQREMIKDHIPRVSNSKIKLSNLSFSYNPENMVEQTLDFLSKINPDLYIFFKNILKNNQFLIKNNSKQNSFAGTTYSLTDCSFFEILLNSSSNPFLTLNHEIVHGYINKLTKRRFENPNSYILYREVANILIEFYANYYLYINTLISYEEFVANFNDFFVCTSYNSIELIDVLFMLATNTNYKNNYFGAKNIINQKSKINPNYDIKVSELTEYPLRHHLIYLYSFMIAICLFYNFKDDYKKGLEAAIDIMSNVTFENEQELFKKYQLDPEKSLNNYIDENNEMISKKNS